MATSLVLVKSFLYRADANEEWSNRYYLTGADPASPAEWTTLFDAFVAQEKLLYPATTKVVRGYGYTDDSPTSAAVWSRDLVAGSITVAGTATPSGRSMPGDVVAVVRWKTSRLTSKGKPIYLRKFFHDPWGQGTTGDLLNTTMKSAYEAFANLLWSGAGIGSRHIRGPGQTSETIVGASCSPYLTTRTLKRRGRRPTSP
jgi:hypothetical protein